MIGIRRRALSVLALIAGLAMAVAAPAGAAKKYATQYSFSGQEAYVYYYAEQGCEDVQVDADIYSGIMKDNTGIHRGVFVEVYDLYQESYCNDDYSGAWYWNDGPVFVPDATFSMDLKTGAAHFEGTIPDLHGQSGSYSSGYSYFTGPLYLNLTFETTGPFVWERYSAMHRGYNYLDTHRNLGNFAYAQVTDGSMSDETGFIDTDLPWTDPTDEQNSDSYLGSWKTSEHTITTEPPLSHNVHE